MSSELALHIASKDQIKVFKKKIQILKEAVKSERKNTQNLQKSISQQKVSNWKIQNELKKKQQKNETLLTEIRQLKDSLIVERNQKQKLIQEIQLLKKAQLNAQDIVSSNANSGSRSTIGGYLSFWK